MDPTNDPTWTVVGQGVSEDYFLGRAIELIRELKTTSDKVTKFRLAIGYLVLWYAKTHEN